MNEHTLPGDLPGLLRRTSPIACVRPEGDESKGCRGLVQDVGMHDDIATIVVSYREPDGASGWKDEWFYETTPDRVALDLTDPTGRIHALWWLLRMDDADTDPIIAFETSGKRWEHIVGAVVTATDDLTPDDLVAFTRVLRAAAEVVRG